MDRYPLCFGENRRDDAPRSQYCKLYGPLTVHFNTFIWLTTISDVFSDADKKRFAENPAYYKEFRHELETELNVRTRHSYSWYLNEVFLSNL